MVPSFIRYTGSMAMALARSSTHRDTVDSFMALSLLSATKSSLVQPVQPSELSKVRTPPVERPAPALLLRSALSKITAHHPLWPRERRQR